MFSKIKYKQWLLCISIIAIVVFSTSCISYKHRPERLFNEVSSKHQTFDALIVPGYPFMGSNWDTIMKSRVIWSYILYKNGIVRNIIYSGAAVYSPYYEAKIMGLYAQALGIPKEHIFYDTVAEHSTENVFYAYNIARKEGFKSIAFGTDPVQSSLLKRFTRKRFATHIQHLPFITDSLNNYSYLSPTIDPSSAFKPNFVPLTEREGFWKRYKGTRGKYIPWHHPSRIEDAL